MKTKCLRDGARRVVHKTTVLCGRGVDITEVLMSSANVPNHIFDDFSYQITRLGVVRRTGSWLPTAKLCEWYTPPRTPPLPRTGLQHSSQARVVACGAQQWLSSSRAGALGCAKNPDNYGSPRSAEPHSIFQVNHTHRKDARYLILGYRAQDIPIGYPAYRSF